jgi:predicted ATP-dependent serine protease
MSDPAPCTRHARTVWMARCPTCTAWHLAVEFARRDGHDTGPAPRSTATAHIREVTRGVVPVGATGSWAA